MITCGTQIVSGSTGGGASAPAGTGVVTVSSGAFVTPAASAATTRATLDAQQDVFTTRGDLVRAGVSGVAERLPLGTNGYVLTSDGTDAAWAAPAGGAPSGAAGGDLGGTYPNPTVVDLTIASEARGDLLRRGASAWERTSAKTSGYVVCGDGTDVVAVAIATPLAVDAGGNRTALGLGGAATLAVGTTAGTVAAGDDSRFLAVGTGAGTVAAGNDVRFITTGLDLARAAAATAGATYLATDTGVVYNDTGSAWVQDLNAGLSGWSGATGKLTSTAASGGTASNPVLCVGGCTWVIRWYQSTVPGGTQRLFATYTNGSRGWQLAMSNPTAGRLGLIMFGVNASSAIENSANITVGWHCAAFSVASGNLTVIHTLDGAAATTTTITGTYLPPVTADTFSIGAGRTSDVPLQSDTELYEIRVLSTALSAAQVAAITATPSVAKLPTLAGVTTDFMVRPSLITPDGTGASWLSKGATPRVVLRTGTLTGTLR